MLNSNPLSKNNKFNTKFEAINLVAIPAEHKSERACLSLDELEAFRTKGPIVPASKHGLEAICGASCDVGAQ